MEKVEKEEKEEGELSKDILLIKSAYGVAIFCEVYRLRGLKI